MGRPPSCGGIHVLFCTFRASGFIFSRVDANCDVDSAENQRSSLVRDLCCCQGLFPLFQSKWTLSWQSPDGSVRKKKVGFVFTNQTSTSGVVSEDMQLRSDHKPLCAFGAMLMTSCWSSRGKRSPWLVGFQLRCHSTMISQIPSLGTLLWTPRLVTFNKCLRVCEPMTHAERCLDVASQELRKPCRLSLRKI